MSRSRIFDVWIDEGRSIMVAGRSGWLRKIIDSFLAKASEGEVHILVFKELNDITHTFMEIKKVDNRVRARPTYEYGFTARDHYMKIWKSLDAVNT